MGLSYFAIYYIFSGILNNDAVFCFLRLTYPAVVRKGFSVYIKCIEKLPGQLAVSDTGMCINGHLNTRLNDT